MSFNGNNRGKTKLICWSAGPTDSTLSKIIILIIIIQNFGQLGQHVTYVRHFFKFQVCTTNDHINYDIILSKSLDSPNPYINWANMWYPDYQNKKLSLCLLIGFKGFHLYIKWAIMWYPDNQLRKQLNLCMLLRPNKNILCKNQIRRIQNMY